MGDDPPMTSPIHIGRTNGGGRGKAQIVGPRWSLNLRSRKFHRDSLSVSSGPPIAVERSMPGPGGRGGKSAAQGPADLSRTRLVLLPISCGHRPGDSLTSQGGPASPLRASSVSSDLHDPQMGRRNRTRHSESWFSSVRVGCLRSGGRGALELLPRAAISGLAKMPGSVVSRTNRDPGPGKCHFSAQYSPASEYPHGYGRYRFSLSQAPRIFTPAA